MQQALWKGNYFCRFHGSIIQIVSIDGLKNLLEAQIIWTCLTTLSDINHIHFLLRDILLIAEKSARASPGVCCAQSINIPIISLSDEGGKTDSSSSLRTPAVQSRETSTHAHRAVNTALQTY